MDYLEKSLVDSGKLSFAQLEAAKKFKRLTPERTLPEILVELNFINETDLMDAAAKAYCFSEPNSSPSLQEEDENARTKLLPYEIAKRFEVFPLHQDEDYLYIAATNPLDLNKIDDIRSITNQRIKALYSPKTQIHQWINKGYRSEEILFDSLNQVIRETKSEPTRPRDSRSEKTVLEVDQISSSDAVIVKLVNHIFSAAVKMRASDIHLDPQDKSVLVRFRIDGELKQITKIPNTHRLALAARIKILSSLDITENRKTQDGRTAISIDHKKIDLRVSVTPVFYGEKIVIRLLDQSEAKIELSKLGLPDKERGVFTDATKRPQGMILITGPTGSGKTSTLYAALNLIKGNHVDNIVTIEDPIEYLMDHINQIQVNPAKNVTFATALRSILRQDPNVILVGEIRDRETADIAFRASMTGHLVLSTLHTNNAAAAVPRLLDIGLEPYLISSSLVLVVAQRLIRLLCPHCKEESAPSPRLFNKFSAQIEELDIGRFYSPKGCKHCRFTGYLGRTGVFEMIQITDKIKSLIAQRAPENSIFAEAQRNGTLSLGEGAMKKVADGLTTLQEVEKCVPFEESDLKEYLFEEENPEEIIPELNLTSTTKLHVSLVENENFKL